MEILVCPNCKKKIILVKKQIICTNCHQNYQVINNIPILTTNLNTQEINQSKIFDKHYSKFPKRKQKIENWRQSMLNRIFDQNFIKKTNYFLDIGCGATGYTVIEASKKFKLSIGTDISLEAMIKAKHLAKLNKIDHKIAFIVCSIENLPFKKNLFNYISCVSVLEHIKNDQKAIKEVITILKNKGFLFICVPNTYLKMWPFIWPFYFFNDIKIGHKRHYSIKKLNQLLSNKFLLKKIIYNGHLIKFLQLFLEKFFKIKNKLWWKLEKKDINKNSWGVQLNTIYQKNV